MKPLMGQVQSQLNLDDLLGPSKVATGNFGRPRASSQGVADAKEARKPNFSEVLLKNLSDSKANASQAKRPETPIVRQLQSRTDLKPSDSRPATSVKNPISNATSSTRASDRPEQPSSNRVELPVNSREYQSSTLANAAAKTSRPTSNSQESSVANTASQEDKSSNSASALVPLQKQIGKSQTTESMANSNPIIAFITGRLEKLEPETLPALIADSALVKQVMNTGDVTQFMESPLSIGELSSMLELDQSLLAKAAREGLNPSELVTPKDFLKALGINPTEVTSELTLLKDKLPTDGVAMYVDRAKALAAMKERGELLPTTPETRTSQSIASNVKKAAEAPTELGKVSITGDQQKPTGENTLAALAGSQSWSAPTMPATQGLTNLAAEPGDIKTTAAGLQSPANILRYQDALASTINTNDFVDANALTSSNIDPNDMADDLIQNEAVTNSPDVADFKLAQAFRNGINPIAAGIGISNSVTNASQIDSTGVATLKTDEILVEDEIEIVKSDVDPFAKIAIELDSNTSTKIEFGGNGFDSRSLEEILVDKKTTQLNPTQTSEINLNPVKADSSDLIEQLRDWKPKDMTSSSWDSFTTDEIGDLTKLAPEVQNEIVLSADSNSQQQGGGELAGGESQNVADLIGQLKEKVSPTRDGQVTFADKLSTTANTHDRASVAQKILGQAEIMFKNGGGAMRMDVEAPGIGKVDVAINLFNNQLDIRIITPSEQARDIISREVAGLRDGLTQQGITLRGLEVGKASDSPRQFAEQGHQQFGQGAQDQRATYNDMKEYVQSFKNSYNPRPTQRPTADIPSVARWGNLASGANSGARLEVRV